MGQEQSAPEGRESDMTGLENSGNSAGSEPLVQRVVRPQHSTPDLGATHDNELPKTFRLPVKRHAENSDGGSGGPNKALKSSSNTRHSFVRADLLGSSPPENDRGRGRASSSVSNVLLPSSNVQDLSPCSKRAHAPVHQQDRHVASHMSPSDSFARSGRPGSSHESTRAALRVEHNGVKNVPTGPSLKKPRENRDVTRVQNMPFIFMPASCLPRLETHIVKHLMGFFRNLKPLDISMDDHGWYLFFENSRSGRDRLNLCYKNYAGQMFFSKYKLEMSCFSEGQQDAEHEHEHSRERNQPSDHTTARAEPSLPRPSSDNMDRQSSGPIDAGSMTKEYTPPGPLVNGTEAASAQRPATQDSNSGSTDAMDISSSEPSLPLAPRLSIRSDRDDTSSVFSGTTHSDGTKSKTRRCYVCKNDAAYRTGGLIQCSTCTKRYHRPCTRGMPVSVTLSVNHAWKCPSCIKKDGASVDALGSAAITTAPNGAAEPQPVRKATSAEVLSPFIKPAVPSAQTAALSFVPALEPPQDSSEAATKQASGTITMEIDPPEPIEASPDPEADDLVAQSFAASSAAPTNANATPKTGKLKLTRTKLKPNPSSIVSTSIQFTTEEHSSGVSERSQDSGTPAAPTLAHSLPSGAPAPQAQTISAVPTAADLRTLAKNKMLKVKAVIEKDLVSKGILQSVSSETARLDAAQVQVNGCVSLPIQERTVGAADLSGETDHIKALTAPLNEKHALSHATGKSQEPKTGLPAALQQSASPTNIAQTDSHGILTIGPTTVHKDPEGSAARAQPPADAAMPPTEKPPAARPRIVRRGGAKAFALLPCSVCKTKISFPVSAGIDPVCSTCKKTSEIDETLQANTLDTNYNEDAVMQDAPALDDPTVPFVRSEMPAHNETEHPARQVAEADETMAAPAEELHATTTNPENTLVAPAEESYAGRTNSEDDVGLGFSASDEGTTSKARSSRKSCDECFLHHTKCTHHRAVFKGIDPRPVSANVEESPGDVEDLDDDSDTETPASGAAQTLDTSFTPIEQTSKTGRKKSSRKSRRPRVVGDDGSSPVTTPLYSDWSDEKLSRLTAILGDSARRPKGSRMKLVGMAMRASPGHRLQTTGVYEWVIANLPMYKRKEGNWEGMLAAQMTQGKETDLVRGYWRMIEWKEGDGGIGTGAWYELLPERKDDLWQWDAVLKEPVVPQLSPQQAKLSGIKVKKVRRQTSTGNMTPSQGISADSTPVSTPSRKISRKTASSYGGGIDRSKAAGRRASRLNNPLQPDDPMDIDELPIETPEARFDIDQQDSTSEKQQNGALVDAELSSDDEPLANIRKPGGSFQPTPMPTAPMLPNAYLRNSEAQPKDAQEDAKSTAPDTLAQAATPPQTLDAATTQSLAQLLKLEALNLDFSASSLFDEWPEQQPDNMFDDEANRAAKQAEIRRRPTRKQLFGKPASHSRINPPAPRILDESPVKRSFVSPEKRPRAIIDARPGDPFPWEKPGYDPTLKKFNSLEDFFDMPDDPIPIMSEGHLAFRDGTRMDNGRLSRGRAVFRAGYDA